MKEEEANLLDGDSSRELALSKSISVFLAVVMTIGGIAVMIPVDNIVVKAPLAGGTLNVTVVNIAPVTNTFQGDMNLTMLWIAMKAEGDNITLEEIKIDTWGIPTQGINRSFLWDDYNGNKEMDFLGCVIAEDTSSPYIFPPAGQLLECTGPNAGQPLVIKLNQTRYFMVLLDLDFDPTQKFTDRDLRVCVKDSYIMSSANNTIPSPFTECSRTIDVNTRIFYDSMQRGQGDWTFDGGDEAGEHPTGLWHISINESDCMNTGGNLPFSHTGNASWWYGHRYDFMGNWICDYYTHEPGNVINSTRNWGRLRTPWIDATKGTNLALTVWQFLSRETYPGKDIADVYVDDGMGYKFITSQWLTNGTWRKLNLNLTAYSGKDLQFEFRFDTVDTLNNQLVGWLLDDIVVYGEVLDHDIAVTNLKVGDYVSLDPQTVSAQVSNVGKFAESNIEVNLTVDGSVVDQKTISLASGENTTVDLTWNPPGEGVYEICVWSAPVPGEFILWNNYECKLVNATSADYTKVAILRSYGTQATAPIETWDELDANWGLYGVNPIQIDYTSLDINPITYEAINDTQADVLVLSGSGYYGNPLLATELSDSETVVIEKWVREGHGFVAIGTAFDQLIPNNNDLVDLVGIADQTYAMDYGTDIQVESGCLAHPVFINVNDLFINEFGYTMSPNNDHSWDVGDLEGGQFCARSSGNHSASIVVFKEAVMISFAADTTPNEDEMQLLYNSFVWSRFQAFDYDVKVSDLIAPNFIRPFYTANISSVVHNIGKKDLSSVQVDLKVDGTPVDTQTINNLLHGSQTFANFSWVPSSEGIYQICVFADIIGFMDEDPGNNEICRSVEVTNNPPVQVFVLDSWGTDFAGQAPWDYLNNNWANHGGTPIYIDYERFNKENIAYQELVDSQADVLLISSSRSGNMGNPAGAGYYFTSEEMDAINRYTQEGHGLIATGLTFDSEKLPAHSGVLGPLFGLKPGNIYTYTTGINNLHILNPWQNHPLFHNITDNYTTASGWTLSPGFAGVPDNWTVSLLTVGQYKALSDPTRNGAVIVYEPGDFNAVYITNFAEKNSNADDKQLLYNAMAWGRSSVTRPTNLWIYKSGDTLRLEWQESLSPKVEGYRIYRATSVNGFDFGSIYDEVVVGTYQWTDPQPDAGIDPIDYFYLVRAFDANGDEEQNLNKVGKFVNHLLKGTNLVSMGFEMTDYSTSTAIESIESIYKSVEAYDPLTCIWKSWTPPGQGDLTEINRSMGLRVRVRADGLLINVGRVAPATIVIPEASACGNWNFVGYPSFVERSLPGVLDDHGMAGKYDLVMYFNPANKKGKWEFYDPSDPDGSTLKAFKPGMGFWIHVTAAGIWKVEGD